jgi:hypothetical protein
LEFKLKGQFGPRHAGEREAAAFDRDCVDGALVYTDKYVMETSIEM